MRYWGFYANAARGKSRKAAQVGDSTQAPDRQDEDEFTRRVRLSWAKSIRRVYEVDPLLCPFCGAEMKILAFIVDFGAAKATAKSLKLPAQEPAPLAHAPPGPDGERELARCHAEATPQPKTPEPLKTKILLRWDLRVDFRWIVGCRMARRFQQPRRRRTDK